MPPVVRVVAVESTQTVAFEMAEAGAVDGTAIVAESQTEGRGRRGRRWIDSPGQTLPVSIILRPKLPPALFPLLSLAAAVGVAASVERVAELSPRLKWPNDLLLRGRKFCGILLESRMHATPLVVIGIGINVNQPQLPPPLDRKATSLALEAGRPVDRDALLAAVLEDVHAWRLRLETQGAAAVREAWLARADTIGRTVSVDGITGRAVDLDGDGALIIENADGGHRVVAGELRAEDTEDRDAARG